MTNTEDARGAMESTLATSGSAPGPVTFSHVFGQQCQLMEAGRKRVSWVAEARRCVGSSLICDLGCRLQLASAVIAQPIYSQVLGQAPGLNVPFGQRERGPVCLLLSLLGVFRA